MKRIIYTLLAATISFTACQKEHHTTPVSGDQSVLITDADFVACKATIGSNKKNTDYGLDMDYELIVKEISNDKFRVKIKLNGMKVNGHEFGNSKLIQGVVWGVVAKLSNNNGEAPLSITLTSTGKNDDTYLFPDFEYKGDLMYELMNAKVSFKIKDGDIKIKDKTTITIGGSDITITGGNLDLSNNSSFLIKEGTDITVNSAKSETSFAILLGAGGKNSSCDDDDDYFVLPKGHAIEQDPKVAKVTFPKGEDGSKVMRITIKGDPEESVTSVYYTPAPVPDPNNPGSTIQPAVIEFHKSDPSNKKIGICCYDRCLDNEKGTDYFCGTTIHLKPADFNTNGPGWSMITLKSEL